MPYPYYKIHINSVPEPPQDGNSYIRQNGEWVPVAVGSDTSYTDILTANLAELRVITHLLSEGLNVKDDVEEIRKDVEDDLEFNENV